MASSRDLPFVLCASLIVSSLLLLSSELAIAQTGNPSGDSYIDNQLYQFKYRAGGKGGAVNRGNNKTACGPGAPHAQEANCPNDATYTPSQYTGGYQAWGIGINLPQIIEQETRCGFYWVANITNGNVVYDYYFVCETFNTTGPGPGISRGLAITRLKWGTSRVVTVDPGGFTPLPRTVELSLLSWL